MKQICKLQFDKKNRIVTTAKKTNFRNIEDLIEHDKHFGILKPRNGKYFTFKIINMSEEELSYRQIRKAVRYGLRRIKFKTNIKIRYRKNPSTLTDLTIIGRTPSTDERKEMDNNTIMYAYFPIDDFDDPDRGIVVVNTDVDFTAHGRNNTVDMDQVFTHEFGHSFGLPHDGNEKSIMYAYENNVDILHERDILRFQAKYGKRTWKKGMEERVLRMFRIRSEDY